MSHQAAALPLPVNAVTIITVLYPLIEDHGSCNTITLCNNYHYDVITKRTSHTFRDGSTGQESHLIQVRCESNWIQKYTRISCPSKASKTPVLYVHVVKVLYRMLQTAFRFYKKLIKDLASIGFETNPYDPCVANRQVS
jgi:hypothetical protein